jgi:hypothetical protein
MNDVEHLALENVLSESSHWRCRSMYSMNASQTRDAVRIPRGQQFIVVKATDDDRIHLDGIHAGGLCRGKSIQHGLKLAALRDLSETVWLKGVEADVDPVEARRSQGTCLFREQCAVGGQRKIAKSWNRPQLPHQRGQTSPHQRLASGEPYLRDTKITKASRAV